MPEKDEIKTSIFLTEKHGLVLARKFLGFGEFELASGTIVVFFMDKAILQYFGKSEYIGELWVMN